MRNRAAIIGAGVSGLTCGVLFAERGWNTTIFADETGQKTTSAAAAAIWFPYDAEPAEKVIPWALTTFRILTELAQDRASGVSMVELRQCAYTGELAPPDWARKIGASALSVVSRAVEKSSSGDSTAFPSSVTRGFALTVPLTDTTIYLDYLATRFRSGGGRVRSRHINKVEDIALDFELVINCAGIGARELVHDSELQPHRGQVVVVPKLELVAGAIVCDGPPLMYVIPRSHDCIFGGTNTSSDDREISPTDTATIVAQCSRLLGIEVPRVMAVKVGIRPFRKTGVRLEPEKLRDGRTVIHNYGHGGAGFTLSWACAEEVYLIASHQITAAA